MIVPKPLWAIAMFIWALAAIVLEIILQLTIPEDRRGIATDNEEDAYAYKIEALHAPVSAPPGTCLTTVPIYEDRAQIAVYTPCAHTGAGKQ